MMMQKFVKHIFTLLRSMQLALKNKKETWATYRGQENKLHVHMNYERRKNSTDDEYKQIKKMQRGTT